MSTSDPASSSSPEQSPQGQSDATPPDPSETSPQTPPAYGPPATYGTPVSPASAQQQYGQGQYAPGQASGASNTATGGQQFPSASGYQAPPTGYPQQPYYAPPQPVYANQKSRLAAGLLGIFLGGLGIHRFYLGYTGIGVAMLLISVLSLGFLAWAIGIWGLVEGILILAKSDSFQADAHGVPLRD